jgi:hypothetical protein
LLNRLHGRGACVGKHRRRRGMIEIEAVASVQKWWIPADCQLNPRPYIGAAAAVHPRAE